MDDVVLTPAEDRMRGTWLALLLALLPGSAMTQLPPSGFEVGDRFPAFRFADVATGEALTHEVLRGHKTIVAIFASW